MRKAYLTTFVNGGNPQLLLLAEFLAAMANGNEEATLRVFSDIRVRCAPGLIRVLGPTNQTDVLIEDGPLTMQHTDGERIAMLVDIFNRLKGDQR